MTIKERILSLGDNHSQNCPRLGPLERYNVKMYHRREICAACQKRYSGKSLVLWRLHVGILAALGNHAAHTGRLKKEDY